MVKKYANRRLYNTETSSYVTLDELSQMVRQERGVRGLRRQDRRGHHPLGPDPDHPRGGQQGAEPVADRLPAPADRLLRRQLHAFLPRYLELCMENFARHQDQIRGYVEETFGRFFPIAQFEDMARQNMALFQRAASMFRPPSRSSRRRGRGSDRCTRPVAAPDDRARPASDQEMRDLRDRMEVAAAPAPALQKTKTAAETPPPPAARSPPTLRARSSEGRDRT